MNARGSAIGWLNNEANMRCQIARVLGSRNQDQIKDASSEAETKETVRGDSQLGVLSWLTRAPRPGRDAVTTCRRRRGGFVVRTALGRFLRYCLYRRKQAQKRVQRHRWIKAERKGKGATLLGMRDRQLKRRRDERCAHCHGWHGGSVTSSVLSSDRRVPGNGNVMTAYRGT